MRLGLFQIVNLSNYNNTTKKKLYFNKVKMDFTEDEMDNEFWEDINDEWGLEID
jgi:hypothetical protein